MWHQIFISTFLSEQRSVLCDPRQSCRTPGRDTGKHQKDINAVKKIKTKPLAKKTCDQPRSDILFPYRRHTWPAVAVCVEKTGVWSNLTEKHLLRFGLVMGSQNHRIRELWIVRPIKSCFHMHWFVTAPLWLVVVKSSFGGCDLCSSPPLVSALWLNSHRGFSVQL